MQNVFERLSAIERPINAAFLVRSIRLARHCDKQAFRILWLDGTLCALWPVAQSDVRPRFARISRFLNAVADAEGRAVQSCAAADVNNVRIRNGHGDCAARS